MMTHKACSACQEEKPIEAFRPKGRQCRVCLAAAQRAYAQTHKDEAYAYYLAHAQEIGARRSARYAANRGKATAQTHTYYLAHAEELRAKARARYHAHLAKHRAISLAYSRSHREEKRAYLKTWNKTHPAQRKAIKAHRRARIAGVAINDFTAAQWIEMQVSYDHRCVYCGERATGHLTQDHLTPLVKGGNHTKQNIVPACRRCNSKKNAGPVPVPVQPLLL